MININKVFGNGKQVVYMYICIFNQYVQYILFIEGIQKKFIIK